MPKKVMLTFTLGALSFPGIPEGKKMPDYVFDGKAREVLQHWDR